LFKDLQINKRISQRKNIWPDITDKKDCRVPCNTAEGYGRKTTPEYIRSIYGLWFKLGEIETQLLIYGDLGYIELK